MISSLYIGASGLKSHGEGMGVVADNLANSNTVGYKQLSMQYADLMSQYAACSGGTLTAMPQQGMGVAPGAVRTLFEQGSSSFAANPTDLYISGSGYFGVSRGDQMQYTRAGNFTFSQDGHLLDAAGWAVMGRPLANGQEGPAEAIVLNTGPGGIQSLPGKAASVVSSSSNLGGLGDNRADPANPFFSLASAWNGAASPPLPEEGYGYSQDVEFFDTTGELRSATIYYDAAGARDGFSAVEYLLAMHPGQDGGERAGGKAAGLLMAGTVTFAADGTMTNLTAFTPPASGDPADLAGWSAAELRDGRPVFTVLPTGAEAQNIALDMGFAFAPDSGMGAASAAELTANPQAVYAAAAGAVVGPQASRAWDETPGMLLHAQDGYAEGGLTDLVVGQDGVITGLYSNGQREDFYRVSLYRFVSQDGLRHEGNNHYSANRESGPAEEGGPGENSFGTINQFALEESNVDYTREFSLLIITQRGFQMNSKVISTTDAMLQKALELKIR
jgi:flagellar hook protein FlgE